MKQDPRKVNEFRRKERSFKILTGSYEFRHLWGTVLTRNSFQKLWEKRDMSLATQDLLCWLVWTGETGRCLLVRIPQETFLKKGIVFFKIWHFAIPNSPGETWKCLAASETPKGHFFFSVTVTVASFKDDGFKEFLERNSDDDSTDEQYGGSVDTEELTWCQRWGGVGWCWQAHWSSQYKLCSHHILWPWFLSKF